MVELMHSAEHAADDHRRSGLGRPVRRRRLQLASRRAHGRHEGPPVPDGPQHGPLGPRSTSPGVQNGGPIFLMNPYDHRCCQHNVGQGWPYLAEHLWLATPDDGLACIFPLESTVQAKVADGTEVSLATTTHYPFDHTIEIKVSTPKPLAFSLYVRIPGWCDRPAIAINHKIETIAGAKLLSYVRIDREWTTGDPVTLVLPMEIRLRTWAKNHGSVSVDRGPLTYSLAIGEQYVRTGGTDRWPTWEIRPSTPWNYGLVLDPDGPSSSF